MFLHSIKMVSCKTWNNNVIMILYNNSTVYYIVLFLALLRTYMCFTLWNLHTIYLLSHDYFKCYRMNYSLIFIFSYSYAFQDSNSLLFGLQLAIFLSNDMGSKIAVFCLHWGVNIVSGMIWLKVNQNFYRPFIYCTLLSVLIWLKLSPKFLI